MRRSRESTNEAVVSDERITEAEIAELERLHSRLPSKPWRWETEEKWAGGLIRGMTSNEPAVFIEIGGDKIIGEALVAIVNALPKLLSERREREGKLAEADAGWTDAETRCAMEGAQRHHAEEKLAEAEQRATNWEDDAQRYAQNSDYWKKRAEAAEATLAAVSEHIRRTGYRSCPCNRELREALTTPVVSSDRLTQLERAVVDEIRRDLGTNQPRHRLRAALLVIDRLAPPVGNQEGK